MSSKYHISTAAVHAGENQAGKARPINTPIYQTATFYLDDDIYKAMERGLVRDHYIYTRYGNPTQQAAAAKIAALEGAESGLVFSSGMAAISTTLLSLLKPGDHLVSGRDLYGGTHAFIHQKLASLGIEITFFDTADTQALRQALRPNTKVVYFETLTNPVLKVADVETLASLAHGVGALAVVDNTFPTPINLRPIEWGVDVVLHSGSKYLNGHSDLICGAAVGSQKLCDEIWKQLLNFGGCLDPIAAYHLNRGLKTLALRMERHNANALRLASWLTQHGAVDQVFYPLLESHPQYTTAQKYLGGGSGVVAFRLKGGDQAALDLLPHFTLFKVASSLGGVDSLVSLPLNTSHVQFSPEKRAEMGILPGTVRLSVGIEDSSDLLDDLGGALDRLA